VGCQDNALVRLFRSDQCVRAPTKQRYGPTQRTINWCNGFCMNFLQYFPDFERKKSIITEEKKVMIYT
jgi:hypothetical protein